MDYLWCFLCGGLLCAVGQVLIDLTKLTPARILTGYVVAGVILQAVGLYQPLVDWAGAGCAVVGEAANGEEALQAAARQQRVAGGHEQAEHQSGHAAEQILSDRHLLSLPICGKPRQCRGNFLAKT